jgi:uncharacterized membrane protein
MFDWYWQLSPVMRVFGLMMVGTMLLALYNVRTKLVLSNQKFWAGRDAAVATLVMGYCSLMLFVICAFTGGPQVQRGFWVPVVLTGVLNIVIQYANMRSKALEDVSLVSPISSTTPAIVILTSFIILGEFPTPLGWAGIWVMVAGTYILAIQDVWQKLAAREQARAEHRSRLGFWFSIWFAPFIALKSSRGVRWAFLSALVGSVSLNYDGEAARTANIAFGAACVFGITALGNLFFFGGLKQLQGLDMRYATKKTLWLALLFALLHLAINPTYRETIVPYVGTLKRLAIPFTIVLAALPPLRERKSFRQRLVGGTLMAIGATLIGVGMKQK